MLKGSQNTFQGMLISASLGTERGYAWKCDTAERQMHAHGTC